MNQCPKCQREFDPDTFLGCAQYDCTVKSQRSFPPPLLLVDDPVELIPRKADPSIFCQRWRMGAGWP